MKPSRPCRKCGLQIRWIRTPTGRNVPIDANPSVINGRIRVTADLGVVLGGFALDQARRAGEALYVPHFAGCPGENVFKQQRPYRAFAERGVSKHAEVQLDLLSTMKES